MGREGGGGSGSRVHVMPSFMLECGSFWVCVGEGEGVCERGEGVKESNGV